ncbi:hypothetical protein [Aggregatilinea lenta]|uniref:hypothetical protein n=1 Tax=Aggregatilinea lenta TaxID=913108 RepID=UPI000E5AABDF|nr:hypothetical protein [Aggregatilinea lenta]
MTYKEKRKRSPWQPPQLARPSGAAIVGSSAIGALALYALLSGDVWVAAGWGMAAMLIFLVVLAVYFWGSLVFGGTLSAFGSSRPVPWTFGAVEDATHDIDPGIEILSAGVLAYYDDVAEAVPCFRTVPARGLRAVRPFLVARSGMDEMRDFEFELVDAHDRARFRRRIEQALSSTPGLVILPLPLALASARPELVWGWRVRSGITVLATFHIDLTDETLRHSGMLEDAGGDHGPLGVLLHELATREPADLPVERLQEGV